MNPAPSREEEIFLEAAALPADQRPAFLNAACAGDADLRERIEGLLESHEGAENFLHPPAATNIARVLGEHAPPELAGQTIGRYKLLQKIGEGGCGVVYMAEQQEPVRRRVALKVIKLGMDTKEVIARFEAERQALALMDHPHIARVFDAGATAAGRPYFVMELVRGLPITKYCDEQNLPTGKRLELFTQVCHAVQHAHQKGIIHRDLKPSNILVTLNDGVAVPKVIDFGIAKATHGGLTDRTLFTAFDQFIGTPAYMAPEQAEMTSLDIDTRSDIYSLGVLLYELLAGRPPFDPKSLVNAGLAEIRRIIREVEPPRPSTSLSTLPAADRAAVAKLRSTAPAQLSTLLRGDLDWVVMRCLEKDRTRRYDTPSALAADIARHLGHEPVLARPPSTAYRLGKMIRRNRLAFAATAAIAVTVVAGAAIASWQAVRATRAERLAWSRLESELAAHENAEKQKNVAEEERNRAQAEAASSAAVVSFLQNEFLVQAAPNRQSDPNIKLKTALDRAGQKLKGRFVQQPLVEATLRATFASTYRSLGEYPAMQEHLERAIELRRNLLGAEHPLTLRSMDELSNALRHLGKFAEAEALSAKTLPLLEEVMGPENALTLSAMVNLVALYRDQGRLAESEALALRTLAIQKRVLGPEHPGTLVGMNGLAFGYQKQQRYPEAAALYQEILEMRKRVLGTRHPDTLDTMSSLSSTYRALGELNKAETLAQATLATRRQVLGLEHPLTLNSQSGLANIYRSQKRFAEARSLLVATLEKRTRLLGAEHPDTLSTMHHLAGVVLDEGKRNEAASIYRTVLDGRARVMGASHPETLQTMQNLGSVLLRSRKFADAEVILRQAWERLAERQPDGWQTASARSRLGEALAGLERFAEAEPMVVEGYDTLRKQAGVIPAGSKVQIRTAANRIVPLYVAWKKPEQAEAWRRKLADEAETAPATVAGSPRE